MDIKHYCRNLTLSFQGKPFFPVCFRLPRMYDIVDADEWLSKNDISIGKESSNWHEQIDTYIDDLDGEDVLVSVDYHM